MSIWSVIADATMRAAVKHIVQQDPKGNIDSDKLTTTLRATLKAAIPELQEEFKMMSEQQLRWAVNVQANALAAKAITAYRV